MFAVELSFKGFSDDFGEAFFCEREFGRNSLFPA